MKTLKIIPIILTLIFISACEKKCSATFCKGATDQSYGPDFKVYITGVNDHNIPLKYACSSSKIMGISPPISWEGVPKSATRIHLLVEDATCTYMCNDCCKYHHWQLDFPLDDPSFPYKNGFPENASVSDTLKPYTLPNSSDIKEYMNFCPPKDQTHAIVIQLTAYHMENGKKVIDGRSQSRPYLISLEPSHPKVLN
ncbi:MAG: hypothetical protein KFB93_06160 [Simkaniaceae bacterium]|nr:MAG: hypothetical protein KFB93_06160 [Simkaniaceae bacterium]